MITEAVEGGRALAAQLHRDVCRISRPSGGVPDVDPDTGLLTPPDPTVVYEGPCRVRTPTAIDREYETGDEQVTATRVIVKVPWNVPEVRNEDIIDVLESGDPHLHLRRFTVTGWTSSTFLHERKIAAEVLA